ncbi:hypothetical protein QVD17_07873 [Tagetes erecta]|uniref:Uncharacterized protein n=1 Tax=Tagetes erecta TaxID=13708 RepID=A0AAD8KXC4_TARER|nr:hypothetical protein QVD17_07873 [Tagetes erecta]
MILSALAAGTPSSAAPHGFKTRHASSLAHRPTTGSDTICNIPARRTMILSALAAGTPSSAAPHGFKTRHGRGGYHTLIKQCLVVLPTDMGSYNPPPFGGPASSLAHRPTTGSDTICNIPARRTMILSALAAGTPSSAAPHGFKTRHGRGGYHTLIKQCLVLLPTDVGSYTRDMI